jgi:hypothetical protein
MRLICLALVVGSHAAQIRAAPDVACCWNVFVVIACWTFDHRINDRARRPDLLRTHHFALAPTSLTWVPLVLSWASSMGQTENSPFAALSVRDLR